MTAEIAILNKSAVALAADSAITIGAGPDAKIYNTVNKIFGYGRSSDRPAGGLSPYKDGPVSEAVQAGQPKRSGT